MRTTAGEPSQLCLRILKEAGGIAESDRRQSRLEQVEREALLAHHQGALVAAERLGDEVGDD